MAKYLSSDRWISEVVSQEISAPQSYPDACKDIKLQPEATDGEHIGVPKPI
jgi:hypothetical protein